jgi:hypothetical protein
MRPRDPFDNGQIELLVEARLIKQDLGFDRTISNEVSAVIERGALSSSSNYL